MSAMCEPLSEEKQHRCEWSGSPHNCLCRDGVLYLQCLFGERLDSSKDIIPAILLTSILERASQRLLSLILKLLWLKASGRIRAGKGIQGFLFDYVTCFCFHISTCASGKQQQKLEWLYGYRLVINTWLFTHGITWLTGSYGSLPLPSIKREYLTAQHQPQKRSKF